jgi:hypothetical protein
LALDEHGYQLFQAGRFCRPPFGSLPGLDNLKIVPVTGWFAKPQVACRRRINMRWRPSFYFFKPVELIANFP